MKLRQLKYFVKVVELGSMGRAAQSLGVVTSTLSQQISRLEGELSTRLLQRTSSGVIPTASGTAFWKEAVLILRHAENAVIAAQSARLGGHVSVGLAPTTASVLGVAFLQEMKERYPDIRLHLVESLSGNLSHMLNASQLDLAVIFHASAHQEWTILPVLEEQLFVIGHREFYEYLNNERVTLADIISIPMVLPTSSHGLRTIIDTAFFNCGYEPNLIAEIDGLSMLMDVVKAGKAVTIQPGAATVRANDEHIVGALLEHPGLFRKNLIASLTDNQLSPAGLAARVVLADVMKSLTLDSKWPGATLI